MIFYQPIKNTSRYSRQYVTVYSGTQGCSKPIPYAEQVHIFTEWQSGDEAKQWSPSWKVILQGEQAFSELEVYFWPLKGSQGTMLLLRQQNAQGFIFLRLEGPIVLLSTAEMNKWLILPVAAVFPSLRFSIHLASFI